MTKTNRPRKRTQKRNPVLAAAVRELSLRGWHAFDAWQRAHDRYERSPLYSPERSAAIDEAAREAKAMSKAFKAALAVAKVERGPHG